MEKPGSTFRETKAGRLWFGTTEDGWSVTDPEDSRLREAMYALRYAPLSGLRREDLFTVLAAADDYLFLTTYPLRSVAKRKFVDICRVLKDRD